MEQLARSCRCAELGRLAQALGRALPTGSGGVPWRLADQDTRILGIAVLAGILRGNTEEAVNLVNAPHLAEERGIELLDTRDPASPDFTELIVVRLRAGEGSTEVAGTGVGPRNIPYLARVWGEDFYLPFAEHLAIFRYTDQPGMIGRVGTIFGEEDVNIVSAAVGAEPESDTAVMALTTDAPVNPSTIDRILELEGFSIGRAVSL
jgi:D-3-phosphoglycerate dehydrogenase